MGLNVRHVARGGEDVGADDARGGPLADERAEGGEDVGAAARGAQGDGPAAAAREDEGGGAVVVGVAVGVRADGLGGLAVAAAGALGGGVVVARAAVGGGARALAGGEARVEDGARDVVVRVGVDAVAGLGRRGRLEVPGAPVADVGARLAGLVGHGVGGVGVEDGAGAVGRGEVAGGGDAGRGDEVGGRGGGVDGGGVGDVLEAERDVVAVDDGDVDEVLVGRDAGGEVELGQSRGRVALGGRELSAGFKPYGLDNHDGKGGHAYC